MESRRDLRLLAGATFLSSAGDLLARIVLALQVHDLTGSGIAVAALVATTLVPIVAVAPLAGLVADRLESVRVLVVASLVQGVVAAALAFSGDLAAILVLSSLLAAANGFGQPAEFTLVPAVAGRRGVAHATGVVESARFAGFAAGPLLAATLATVGTRPALLVNAACFFAVMAVAGALSVRRQARARAAGTSSGALDGLRVLGADRVLRLTLAFATGALVLVSATLTAEIFYVKDVVGAGDAGYALVVAGWMAGMVCGAAAVARRVPAGMVAAGALLALAVQGAGIAGQTLVAILPLAFAGFLLGGVGHGVKNVLLRVLITTRVSDALHGRAFAAYNAARNTAELAAVGAGGVLVTVIGPRAALVLAGLGAVLAAAAGLAALHSRRAVRPAQLATDPAYS
jgi:MFS family permease